jgi:hypothetical protein
MAGTKGSANGGGPTSVSSAGNGVAGSPDSQRAKARNGIAPDLLSVPDREDEGTRSRRGRDNGQRRAREDTMRANWRNGKRGRERSDREQESSSMMNAIRPTNRRDREVVSSQRESPSPDRNPHFVPDEVKQRFVQVGKKYHFPDGARAFTDHGNRLTSPSENTEVVKSLISIAQARGWSDITISGTERFRKEAWLAARLAGLDARGYSPTEFEQGRLVRMLAREQGVRAPDVTTGSAVSPPVGRTDVNQRQNDRPAEPARPRERQRALQTGRLVDHGAAPYLHDPHNAMSYFVRLETSEGERDIWGVDLRRALKDSLTRPKIGDEIGVRALRRDAVKVFRPEHDVDGRMIGEKTLEAHRNAWIVEKRDFFKERGQAARVLRDSSVDRQQAVKQHPELLGTYLQLHAAELAAKTLRNPEDQRRFVASVRTALADSVARGEPLSPVPMKEQTTQRREPRSPSVRERDAAPTR